MLAAIAITVAVTAGSFDRESFLNDLVRSRDTFETCYRNGGELPTGTIEITFTVTPQGAAENLSVVRDTLAKQAITDCVVRTLGGRAKFSPAPANPVSIRFAFQFAPSRPFPIPPLPEQPPSPAQDATTKAPPGEPLSTDSYVKQLGISSADASAWLSAGISPATATEWLLAGFAVGEATAWGGRNFAIENATEWKKAGFAAEEAATWKEAGFSPEDATSWRKLKFAPGTASRFSRFSATQVAPEARGCDAVGSAESLLSLGPYDSKGKCFEFEGTRLQVLDATTALFKLANSTYHVSFKRGVPRVTIEGAVIRGTGTFKYGTAGGASSIVPKLEVVAFAQPDDGDDDAPSLEDEGFDAPTILRLKRDCPEGVSSVSKIIGASPFELKGKCYFFAGDRIQVLGPKAALYTMGSTHAGDALVYHVTFKQGSAKPSLGMTIVRGTGTYSYTAANGAARIAAKVDAIAVAGNQQ